MTPEEQALAYYGGTPGVNMSVAPPPPPMSVDPAAAYYGAPPPPPPPPPVPASMPEPLMSTGPAPLPPEDPRALVQPTMSVASPPPPPPEPVHGTPGVDMSAPPPVRQPVAFERGPTLAPKPPPTRAPAGPANPDPYGQKSAQTKLLGTYEAEMEAKRREGIAEADKAGVQAQGHLSLADLEKRLAEESRLESDAAFKKSDENFAEAQRQLDDVKAKKVEPLRLMKDEGIAAASIIGGILGGIYQGVNRLQKNPFIEELNRTLDRDVDAQNAEIQNARSNVSDRINLLQQQRNAFKDKQLGDLQYRNMLLEGFKEGISADAARYDEPIIKARSEQGISAVNRQQSELQKAIADRNAQLAAQAAAAGAAARSKASAEMRKAYQDTFDKVIGAGHSPEQAEAEANRMVAQLYAGGAGERAATPAGHDPIAAVPKDQRAKALEEQEAYAKAAGSKRNIETVFERYSKTGITSPKQLAAFRADIAKTVKAGAGPGMSSDEDYTRFIEPLLPSAADTASTLETKRQLITNGLMGSVTTPLLDRHAPGWRPKDLDLRSVK